MQTGKTFQSKKLEEHAPIRLQLPVEFEFLSKKEVLAFTIPIDKDPQPAFQVENDASSGLRWTSNFAWCVGQACPDVKRTMLFGILGESGDLG